MTFALVLALDASFKKKAPHRSVRAYVVLPNGSLSADGVLEHPARFTKKDGKPTPL